MNNKLILRSLESPFSDITKNSKLTIADGDNNFIFLKGSDLSAATTTGTVLSLIKNNGEIINVSWLILYDKKPHDWVTYLSGSEKYQYSTRQRYDTDELLVKKFFNTLPKDVIREIKINSIMS